MDFHPTIDAVIRARARMHAMSPVLFAPGHPPLGSGALAICATEMRQALRGAGLGRDARVLVIVEDRPRALAAFLAVAAAATAVPLPADLSDRERDAIIAQVRPDAAVIDGALFETMGSALPARIRCLRVDDLQHRFWPHLQTPHTDTASDTDAAKAEDIAALLLSWDGGTAPGLVPLRHDTAMRRAAAEAAYLGLTASDIGMDIHANCPGAAVIAGLLATLYAGGALTVAPSAAPQDIDAALIRDGATWLRGAPSRLRHIHRAAGLMEQPKLRLIQSTGTGLPATVRAGLAQRFGAACVQTYGMAETGPIVMVPPQTTGAAQADPDICEIALLDESGAPAHPGGAGRIAVRGPLLAEGYFSDPARDTAAFSNGWFLTGDLGIREANGDLTVTGRLSDRIRRGGQFIAPTEVEDALNACPGVADSICFGAPHPTLGQTVAAAVVPDGTPPDRTRLQTRLKTHLPQASVPAQIHFCEAIPLDRTGRPDRAGAARVFADPRAARQATGDRPKGKPADPILRVLTALWAQALHRDEVRPDDQFLDLGGDSMIAARLLSEVAEVFEVHLPEDAFLGQADTIAGLAATIRAARAAAARKSDGAAGSGTDQVVSLFGTSAKPDRLDAPELLRRMQKTAARWGGQELGNDVPVRGFNTSGTLTPLFWCFNAAHEPAAMAAALGPDQPLYALRSFQGLADGDVSKNRLLAQLREPICDEVLHLAGAGAILMGGNCQAGHIMHRVADRLAARGRPPLLLALLDHQPETPYPGRLTMFFGDRSQEYNPFLTDADPQAHWRAIHGPTTHDIVPGGHGTYFRPENLGPFAERLKVRLQEALTSHAPRGLSARRGAAGSAVDR